MAKPIWQIQRELEAAQARDAFYSNPNRPIKATRDAMPRDAVSYAPLLYKVGSDFPPLLLNSSRAGIAKFGGAATLGLVTTALALSESGRPPRNFSPSIVKCMVGDATPQVRRAFNGTGRRYVRYAANTTGSAQAHFSAPISCGNNTPTIDELETRAAAAKTAAGNLGEYGRFYLEIEKFTRG